MSSRPQFNPYIVIPNAEANPANSGDMSLTLTSQPTIVQKLSMIAYQINWAGAAPVGAISVEASNDFSLNADGSVRNAGNWTAVPLAFNNTNAFSVPLTGAAGSGVVDIDAMGMYALRLVYTPTSGTGVLQAIINAKVA